MNKHLLQQALDARITALMCYYDNVDRPGLKAALCIELEPVAQPEQPSDEIHSCSFFCDLPACIKTQRDLLRDQLCKKATP